MSRRGRLDLAIYGLALFTALIAMFAFASAVQGWFVRKNHWYECLILVMVTLVLLRPGLFTGWVPWVPRMAWQGIGLTLMAGLFIFQRASVPRPGSKGM